MVKQYSQNINTNTNFIPDHNICQWWATILQEGSHKNPKTRHGPCKLCDNGGSHTFQCHVML